MTVRPTAAHWVIDPGGDPLAVLAVLGDQSEWGDWLVRCKRAMRIAVLCFNRASHIALPNVLRNHSGETDTGFRGFTWTPWASSSSPPHRVYGVF